MKAEIPVGRPKKGGFDLYLLVTFVLLAGFAFYLTGGPKSASDNSAPGARVIIDPFNEENREESLQLGALRGATVTPGPIIPTTQPGTPPPPSNCSSTISDTVIVIDHSSSMDGEQLREAKVAANLFIDTIAVNNTSRVGLVQFDEGSEILSQLSENYTTVKNAVNAITESSGSCVQCGVKNGRIVHETGFRSNVKRAVILLTDGRANRIDGNDADRVPASDATMDEAMLSFNNQQVVYYTIGWGDEVYTPLMQGLANNTGGLYYHSPTQNELQDAFSTIANKICT